MDPEKSNVRGWRNTARSEEPTEGRPKTASDMLGRPMLPQTSLEENLIGWDGQDDATMPMNFPRSQKWLLLGLVAGMNFLSPLTSTLPAPGVSEMNIDFHNTNSQLTTFVISVFVLGYVIGPCFLAPLSEIYGRRHVLSAANIFFTVWQLACALAPSLKSLVAFRLLAGIGAAGCMTLGGGVIADLYIPKQRGKANAIFAMGPLFGPGVGPVMGGFIAARAGWRWGYWVLFIATGTVTVVTMIFNRETYAPVILMSKTTKMARDLDRPNLRSGYEAEGTRLPRTAILKHGILRPLRMLFLSPIIAVFCAYEALVYGLLYLLLTTISGVYISTYGWAPELSGLGFLGLGVGFFVGLAITGASSDKVIITLTHKNNDVYEPEMRLPFMGIFGLLIPISFFWYGWSAETGVQWIMPTLGLVPFGAGMIGIFIAIQTYLIDAFTLYSASAVAALTVSRSLFGALLPLAGPKMYMTLGLGWGNSLLGFIALLMVPAPYYLWKYGKQIRDKYTIEL